MDSRVERTNHRDHTTGKFIKNPCDCCGKPAPMDYFSGEFCNETGMGLTLCARVGCQKVVNSLATVEEYKAFFKLVEAIRAW